MRIEDLTARDIMKSDVLTVPGTMKISELVEFLQDERITGAPVVNDRGKLAGVVSETDLMRVESLPRTPQDEDHPFYRSLWRVSENEDIDFDLDDDVGENSVEQIMTPSIISASENTPITDLARMMHEKHVHRILIVDSKTELKGIVTTMDIVKIVSELIPVRTNA